MKILLCADAHGELPIISKNEKVDLMLVAGDFAKGDALRRMIFENGSREEAKQEIIESSEFFIKQMKKFNCPVVFGLGNAEEFCKKEIVELMKKNGILYSENGIVEILGLKILCVNFFLEEWWARRYRSERQSTVDRAIKDEKKLKKLFSRLGTVEIIVSHLPPYGILDKDQGLNELGASIGSKILREFIDKKKPKLVVCGHLHNPEEKKFGKTLVVNPGKEKIIEL